MMMTTTTIDNVMGITPFAWAKRIQKQFSVMNAWLENINMELYGAVSRRERVHPLCCFIRFTKYVRCL